MNCDIIVVVMGIKLRIMIELLFGHCSKTYRVTS